MCVKTGWEKDANVKLTEEEWLNLCKTQSTTSSAHLWREFSWKNISRFFYKAINLSIGSAAGCVLITLQVISTYSGIVPLSLTGWTLWPQSDPLSEQRSILISMLYI